MTLIKLLSSGKKNKSYHTSHVLYVLNNFHFLISLIYSYFILFPDGVDIHLVVDPIAGGHGLHLRHRERPRGHGGQD